ncbi:MAG: elongation factor P [Erysipelotrichaceae bacterium]|nr:elongation factor P [Erysipelotrichaceae bacterium]
MAEKIECTALKPGMYFLDGADLLKCISADRNKTAMRKMVVIVKCRNMRTGAVKEMTFSGETIETAYIEKKNVSYSWNDGETYYFYSEDGNEFSIPADRLEDEKLYLVDGLELSLQIYDDSEILGVILPDKVEMELVECEEAVKGNTATSAEKNAVTETGLNVRVPMFIKNGERIIISTETGKYSSRA